MAETRSSSAGDASSTALEGLKALVERAGERIREPAPVDKWDPERVGEIDILIKSDGTWLHEGSPIGRERLVRVFSTVLRKDADGETYLVTPVERLKVRVEDAAFVAVEVNISNVGDEQAITFRTNLGDVVKAGPDHPLRFDIDDSNGGIKPYVRVRGRLEALLTRAVTHELLASGEEMDVGGETFFAVSSRGIAFPVMAADRLSRLVTAEEE